MSRIFGTTPSLSPAPTESRSTASRLKKLQEKRMALGHKLDDHEEQWPDLTM